MNSAGDLYGQGGGTVATAAIAAGGQRPGTVALTESWDGTSWTEVGDLNTARYQAAASTYGSPTSFLLFGGQPNRAVTELFNGTSWTEIGDLATGRTSLAGAGVTTSALAFGGSNPSGPGAQATTEEWSANDFEIKTMTTS
jgi:hypothetical protein